MPQIQKDNEQFVTMITVYELSPLHRTPPTPNTTSLNTVYSILQQCQ